MKGPKALAQGPVVVGGPEEVTHPDQVPLTNTQGEVVDVALGGASVSVAVGGASVCVSVGRGIDLVGVAVLGDNVALGLGFSGVGVSPGNSQARAVNSRMIRTSSMFRFLFAKPIVDSLRVDRPEVIDFHCTRLSKTCLQRAGIFPSLTFPTRSCRMIAGYILKASTDEVIEHQVARSKPGMQIKRLWF